MGVADGVDSDAPEQVEVPLAAVIPDVGALAAVQEERGRAVGAHQRLAVPGEEVAAHEVAAFAPDLGFGVSGFCGLGASPARTMVPMPSVVKISVRIACGTLPSMM